MNSYSVIASSAILLALFSGPNSGVAASLDGAALVNVPPVVSTGGNAGDNYFVDCNNYFNGKLDVTSVQLDGSGSYDPDGTPVTFFWHNECDFGTFDDPTSPTPVYTVDMTGVCDRECWVALRVSSGGQTSVKGFRVIVQDMSFPVVLPPTDYLGIWGDSTDVANTGAPSIDDNCDPAPVVVIQDTVIPATGPGQPELNMERLWTVTDCVGFTVTQAQTITLLAPTGYPGKSANLDFDPDSCPNDYSLTQAGDVEIVLVGLDGFRAERVIPGSLRLWVHEAPGLALAPNSMVLTDCASHVASYYGDCNMKAPDGKLDLKLRFDRATFAAYFDLYRFPGQTIEVMVTGNMKTSFKLFGTRDVVILH